MLLSIAILLVEYAGLKYLTKFLVIRVNNTKDFFVHNQITLFHLFLPLNHA